jgi:hypothetical protein
MIPPYAQRHIPLDIGNVCCAVQGALTIRSVALGCISGYRVSLGGSIAVNKVGKHPIFTFETLYSGQITECKQLVKILIPGINKPGWLGPAQECKPARQIEQAGK